MSVLLLFSFQLDFSDASLSENAECLVGTVAAYKQHLPKGRLHVCILVYLQPRPGNETNLLIIIAILAASFIVRVVVSTTYGPGFLLNLNQFI